VREHFVVGIVYEAALRVNRLLVDVLLSGESRVLIVLEHLQVNETKRKSAED
jgi:hypothetical protein